MTKYAMSVPDMLLQLFVMIMAGWGIYGKWIAPRVQQFRNRRTLSGMLLSQETLLLAKHDVTAPAASNPVTLEEPSEDHYYDEISALDDGETEEESTESESDTREDQEDEEEDDSDGELVENIDRFDRAEVEPDPDLEEEDEAPVAKVAETVRFPRFLSAQKVDPNAAWNGFVAQLLGSANHLIVIGASGGGKTVTMYNLVDNLLRNAIPVIVCDPDAAVGDWPGADVYGGGDDFESINAVLKELAVVMRDRRRLRSEGVREFEPMWFVFDEFQDTKDECVLAATVIENGLRRARKLNIHLMIGVQDTQVKTMGFERKSSLLEHARIIKLIKRMDGSRLLRLDDETTSILVPKFAVNTSNATTPLSPPSPSTPLFRQRVEEANDDEDDMLDHPPEVEGDGKEPIIAELIRAGWSYNRIVTHMGTSSARISRIKHKMEDATNGV